MKKFDGIKSIEVICPLYNAGKYIKDLHKSLLRQKNIFIDRISYLVTESNDDTLDFVRNNCIEYWTLKKEEFSHSLTREERAMNSDADIVVFITQDIQIEDPYMLYNLTKDIMDDKCDAAYARQISKYNNIEKYTREKNYPSYSSIVSIDNVKEKGLRTFFFSDACSAIKTSVFKKLNGYDGKNLPISEDMYIAYKLITNGYKIKYESNAVVYHSHNFKLKELYKRYKLTGEFFKENSYLDKYGTNGTGGGLAKYILKRAVEDKNTKVLLNFIPNMAARYIGMQVGKRG